jgi:hypothetical protein
MFPLECVRTGAILLRSDWGRPCLSGRMGTKVKTSTGFTAGSTPNAAVRENGTYEATRQSRRLRTAYGFAVCGFRATLASILEICKQRWVDPLRRSTDHARASAGFS